jgi:vacuolar-type H+-ATPase subunit E/Vma4
MGHQELITSLQKEAGDKISLIRDEAERAIQKIKTELSDRIRQLKEEYRKKEAAEISEHEENIRSEAAQSMRGIRLSSEKRLSDRLLPLARSCLHTLRDKHYRSIFASLVKELPRGTWSEISVNPEDTALAREHFPDSQVHGNSGITGGFVAVLEKGNVCVTNTFEKRLERAWEDVLPLIMRDACKGVKDNEHPVE